MTNSTINSQQERSESSHQDINNSPVQNQDFYIPPEIPEPPCFDATTQGEMRELIKWAIENKQMLEIVYSKKTRRNIPEVTARIVSVIAMEGQYVQTICYATLRYGVLEYHESTDNIRNFIIYNITRVRVTNLVLDQET